MTVVHLPLPLSTSPYGEPFLVSATAHPAQLIHQTSATEIQFLTIWAVNITNQDVLVTTFTTPAGTATSSSSPTSTSRILHPYEGKILLEPGIMLTGQRELRIFASLANVVSISGYVYQRSSS